METREVWTAIHTFPAADGSRTLRVSVPMDVVEALYCGSGAIGFRQTCLRGDLSGRPRLISKTEVLSYSGWTCHMPVVPTKRESQLPAVVWQELKRGRLRWVNSRVEGMRLNTVAEVETIEGDRLSLNEWLRRESCQVEMCLPLSKEEAEAFLDQGVIKGLRHSFVFDPETGNGIHSVEASPTGQRWDLLTGDAIAKPHFRITFHNKLTHNRTRLVHISNTPWLQEEQSEENTLPIK
eukprot:Protomagalhaensia_wolfi_Nauph_80__532@NODE_12_length_5322_cov_729_645845_g9_i0_p3_GENE_NODE_12_length_5322_cov_729_645845_g9_i0NODE_12_length_5322_cov_729_645845_g9_i0_p3_ORF_typecomplete_len237_score39_88_NODE_12_length_5322_cov_729_645845_g9_i021662876